MRIRSNAIALNNRGGLTMLEIVISLVLVSTLLIVSLEASARLLQNQSQAQDSLVSRELGGMLLDEISAMPFRDFDQPDNFGLEGGETLSVRSTYDDVDDYHGFIDSPPVHRDGTAIEEGQGWTRSVEITPAVYATTGVTLTSDPNDPYRVLSVTCTSPGGVVVTQSVLVSDVPNDLSESGSHQRLRRARFTFAPDRVLDVVVPLRNFPPLNN